MSIALLHQVYDETRRLAVAGSATAPGDFRLKKLIDPLKQAGTKAPVFAKLAESTNAIIGANEQTAPDAMLELLGLATAIRYTQGETGLPGKIEPLGVKIPIARPTEISARLLQPLLTALRSTGSGRLEVIQDAYKRGAFKDIRLMLPAINGLDDSYSEIAELLAKEIIPQSFGPAIAPYIKAGYDPKGKNGSARRLQLLHKFDPAGTRELVMQALENGSKEVRVAALSCLGLHSDDVHILIEQTSAKAQDVRTAAYYGLSQMESEEAVNALTKIMASKELAHAWRPLAASKGPRLRKAVLAAMRDELAALHGAKDKKAISTGIERIGYFLHSIDVYDDADTDSETMILDLFHQRDKLAKVKGDTLSGSDLNQDVARTLAKSNRKELRAGIVAAHATLDSDSLGIAFDAAHRHLSPAIVYDTFAPYSQKFVGKSNPETVKRHMAVLEHANAAGSHRSYGRPLDPRWLDLAVSLPYLPLVETMARPGHTGLNKYLADGMMAQLEATRKGDELRHYVSVMAQVGHPDFEASFFAAVGAAKFKTDPSAGWFYSNLINNLPKSAIPALEALASKLSGYHARLWTDAIEELRTKPDVA